jgi:hypothetical protein
MTAPAALHVVHRPGKTPWQVIRSHDGGRGPHEDVGPRWPTAKAACEYLRLIDQPFVSPLSGADGSPPLPSASDKAETKTA